MDLNMYYTILFLFIVGLLVMAAVLPKFLDWFDSIVKVAHTKKH